MRKILIAGESIGYRNAGGKRQRLPERQIAQRRAASSSGSRSRGRWR